MPVFFLIIIVLLICVWRSLAFLFAYIGSRARRAKNETTGYESDHDDEWNANKVIGAISTAVVIIIAFVAVLKCTVKVPAGYVGVVYSMNGGIDGEVLSQGWHVVSPMKKVTTYSIGIEQSYLAEESKGDSKKDESFSTPTSDGKSLKVDLEFSYRFDADRVAETFVTFKGRSGEQIKDTFIKPKISAYTQEVTAKYPVTEVFGDKRQDLNQALDAYLKEKFHPYGIIIDTVNFTSISTDEATSQAIQKKVNAQQELELSKIQKNTAEVQAEKDKQVALIEAQKEKEVASINAEKQKIEAEGKADARKIAAEAEAKANREIASSLTPELIEKIKLEKWNGTVPNVQTGNSTPLINIDPR